MAFPSFVATISRWGIGGAAGLAGLLFLGGCCEDETPPVQTYGYGPVNQVVALPGGGRFVSSGHGGAFVWDLESGTVVHRFVTGSLDLVAVAPDGRRVLTAGLGYARDTEEGPPAPRTCWLWDTETGELIRMWADALPATWWMRAAFSPDGSRVAVSGNYNAPNHDVGTVKVYDLLGGQELWELPSSNTIASLAFSPDGAGLLIGGGWRPNSSTSRRVAVLEKRRAESGELQLAFEGHAESVRSAAFSPEGDLVVSGGEDRTARVWQADTGELLLTLPHPAEVLTVAFAPDGARILTRCGDDRGAFLWDAVSGERLHSFTPSGALRDARFTPDGRAVLTYGPYSRDFGRAQLWDADTGQLIRSLISFWRDVASAALVPERRQVVACGRNRLWLWDTATTDIVRRFEGHSEGIAAVEFSPDGEAVLTAGTVGDASAVCLWETDSGKLIRSFPADFHVSVLAFSPDGRWMATGGQAGSDRGQGITSVRAVETGEELFQVATSPGAVLALAFSPDGRQLLTGSGLDAGDESLGTATRWRVGGYPREIWRFEEALGPVSSVAYSPDGSLFATGTGYYDGEEEVGTVRLWDGRSRETSRETVRTFETTGAGSCAVAFSADGTQLLTGGDPVRLWSVETGGLLREYSGGGGIGDSVAFSPDERLVAASRWLPWYNESTDLWDAASGRWLRCVRGVCARFHPDGSFLLTTDEHGTAGLFDLGDVASFLRIRATDAGAGVVWQAGVLQAADEVEGPWWDVPDATSPYPLESDARQRFFRTRTD